MTIVVQLEKVWTNNVIIFFIFFPSRTRRLNLCFFLVIYPVNFDAHDRACHRFKIKKTLITVTSFFAGKQTWFRFWIRKIIIIILLLKKTLPNLTG